MIIKFGLIKDHQHHQRLLKSTIQIINTHNSFSKLHDCSQTVASERALLNYCVICGIVRQQQQTTTCIQISKASRGAACYSSHSEWSCKCARGSRCQPGWCRCRGACVRWQLSAQPLCPPALGVWAWAPSPHVCGSWLWRSPDPSLSFHLPIPVFLWGIFWTRFWGMNELYHISHRPLNMGLR